MPGLDELAGLVEEIAAETLELRRLLHRHPEPAHREHRTTDLVRRFVESHGLQFTGRGPKTGGWVDLGHAALVGFRADIDALPIKEPAGNSPRSETEAGCMPAATTPTPRSRLVLR